MLGQLGQLMSLLKNSGRIQQGMADLQARLSAARFVGDAGAGQVRATVDGRSELVSIRIDPTATRDLELLEDLIIAAVRSAAAQSREAAQKEVQALTGGLGLDGLDLSRMFGAP